MSSCLYCDSIPSYVYDACATEKGRITGVAFIRCDFDFTDPTDANEWQTGIDAGQIHVIKSVRGAKPKATQTTIDGFGLQRTKTVGYERTATYQHTGVEGNEDFYDALNFDGSHRFAYVTADNKVWIGDSAVANVDADHVVEEGLDTIIYWDVAVDWSANTVHVAYDIPTGIF